MVNIQKLSDPKQPLKLGVIQCGTTLTWHAWGPRFEPQHFPREKKNKAKHQQSPPLFSQELSMCASLSQMVSTDAPIPQSGYESLMACCQL